ncbi:Alpha/Beta hydrolase protein [Diplogelasinospora grovesii]|uniref:Alpha/Beta hydrolase protein n=1 Tax=Diplogelasinospora grovesii TaxID=303347 RepID=A0AAN6ND64_9PEZI|nr:Alpha/Beta hydrolase protein [Diplogelasinospora grovesii]
MIIWGCIGRNGAQIWHKSTRRFGVTKQDSEFLFIGLLTVPYLQSQVIYLNNDVSVPEQWGFLRNQHILPLQLYRQHEPELVKEPEGIAADITTRLGFKLLRDDPNSLLVLYLHGAAGTLGSGWRPPSYLAMYAGAPDRIHTVAIDYRGFGSSSGSPSEEGLLTDATTLATWAMQEAGVPPSRIVIFGQSLGTAVGISLTHHLATAGADDGNPTLFAGMVFVAPFADVELLASTYRIAPIVPILGPLAPFPRLLAFFNSFILTNKLADFVRHCESMPEDGRLKYHITIIHAEDDYDVPWSHSDQLFWHAVNASTPDGISFEELEHQKTQTKTTLGPGGWAMEHKTAKGEIREEIAKWGLHDRIMSYPIVSLAVLRAFQSGSSIAPR